MSALPSAFRLPTSAICLLAALAWLWWRLVDQLRLEWSLNPQYAYGWAVPFLCAYLFWQRLGNAKGEGRSAEGGGRTSAFSFQLIFWGIALLYFPIRLIQEANPEWRMVSWILALQVIALTLLLLGLMTADGGQTAEGKGRISAFQRFSVYLSPLPFAPPPPRHHRDQPGLASHHLALHPHRRRPHLVCRSPSRAKS